MSRPDYPSPYCVLTSNMIQRIRSEQECYDKDPAKWEREERRRTEERELERQQELEWRDRMEDNEQ